MADIAVIKSTRSTDLLAVVRECSETRHPTGQAAVADVTVADNSKASDGKLAEIVIAVWGESKIYFINNHKEQPLVFFNLTMKYDTKGLRASHWKDADVRPAPSSEKANDLQTNMSQLKSEVNVHTLTAE